MNDVQAAPLLKEKGFRGSGAALWSGPLLGINAPNSFKFQCTTFTPAEGFLFSPLGSGVSCRRSGLRIKLQPIYLSYKNEMNVEGPVLFWNNFFAVQKFQRISATFNVN